MTEKIFIVLIDTDAQSATSIQRKLDVSQDAVFDIKVLPRLKPEEASEYSQADAVIFHLSSFAESGEEIFSSARKNIGPHVPILLVAHTKSEPLARELMQKGAQDYLLQEELTPKLLSHTLHYLVKIAKQEKASRENSEQYRMMIENSSDIITLVDKQGKIIFESPAIEKVFGYPPHELEGKSIFDYVHPQEKIQVMEKFKEAMGQGVLNERIQFQFITKGGEWRYIEAVGSTVFDQARGGLIGIINSRDVTERVKVERELFSMTIDDPLTSLLNRRGFMILTAQQVKMAQRTKQGSCLIYADLDKLKWINDTFGHLEGDKALAEIAEILKHSFRDPDIIARIGGDEFAVLAIGALEMHASSLVNRVHDTLQRRNRNPIHPYPLLLSMGVIYVDPFSHTSIENLLSRADLLMYQEKKQRQKAA